MFPTAPVVAGGAWSLLGDVRAFGGGRVGFGGRVAGLRSLRVLGFWAFRGFDQIDALLFSGPTVGSDRRDDGAGTPPRSPAAACRTFLRHAKAPNGMEADVMAGPCINCGLSSNTMAT